MTLTPEREKQIRDAITEAHADAQSAAPEFQLMLMVFQELLAEIDRLRAENDDLRDTRLAIKLDRVEKERDQLREKLSVATGAIETYLKGDRPEYDGSFHFVVTMTFRKALEKIGAAG